MRIGNTNNSIVYNRSQQMRNKPEYGKTASGKRINSAKDDAAGLAIAQKLLKQVNGYDMGAMNIRDGIGVANIADGAMGTMADSLQRIRELSVKASNSAVYGQSERSMMQDEVNQLLNDIEQTATGTEFNTMKILDGSMDKMDIASNPDGSGTSIPMQNATLQGLGIDGYDLTGDFDISRIDSAIEKLSSARSKVGATTNGMEYAYNYNTNASLQLTGAQSRIEDLDMPKAISEVRKRELLNTYQTMMMRNGMETNRRMTSGLF